MLVGFLFLVLSLSAQTFNSLFSFDNGDGANPFAGLIQATDRNFYGTTEGGGANGDGTVFKITPGGKLTTLHSFDGTDGANPYAGLIQATDGNFYGTAESGGANGDGTVFKSTPGGKLTTLHSFDGTNGANPYAGLIQATDGNFYGTTVNGGADYDHEQNTGFGTVFKITAGGKLTTLYSFCSQSNCTDGGYPYAGVIQGTDGNFYGTTLGGGAYGWGTIFKIMPSGKLTTLYSFCSQGYPCTDGLYPYAGLIQATNGSFYGTTVFGGSDDDCSGNYGDIPCGNVFSLSVGLGPFVETNPTSGKVGTAVKILGTDLTGATSVTFNGTVAKFKVVSASLIKTTVPEGATTGEVEVKTPKGTLKSNVVFRVTK